MVLIMLSTTGIPNNETVTKKLKELLPEGEQAEIKVIEYLEEEMKYKIEIPKVYEALKKQGFT
nr:unnamed protein product [Callosobruchus analis]